MLTFQGEADISLVANIGSVINSLLEEIVFDNVQMRSSYTVYN